MDLPRSPRGRRLVQLNWEPLKIGAKTEAGGGGRAPSLLVRDPRMAQRGQGQCNPNIKEDAQVCATYFSFRGRAAAPFKISLSGQGDGGFLEVLPHNTAEQGQHSLTGTRSCKFRVKQEFNMGSQTRASIVFLTVWQGESRLARADVPTPLKYGMFGSPFLLVLAGTFQAPNWLDMFIAVLDERGHWGAAWEMGRGGLSLFLCIYLFTQHNRNMMEKMEKRQTRRHLLCKV